MKILLFIVGVAAILALLDVVEFYMPMEFEDMSVNRHSLYVHLDPVWVSSFKNFFSKSNEFLKLNKSLF